MDGKRWNQLLEAFTTLAEMPASDQMQALRDLYSSDPTLAKEVQELLEEDASGQNLPEENLDHLLAQALRSDQLDPHLQIQIGPYRIIRMLGEGGMGVVYLAERTDIAGSVAIKFLRDSWISPIRRQRFAIEQQTLGLLNHPSIARIYDAGTTSDGTPWFVMEYVDGENITEYLRREPRSAREIIQLFCQICEAVRYAHSHAIIHRDLKPSNIFVTEDRRIKLLDFGIAKQMDMANRESSVTIAGLRLYTPAYAAPELQSDNDVGVFTDIYSLGVILYELLTGSLPYPDGLSDHAPQKPSVLALKKGSNVDLALSKSEWADIDAICMKALDREAECRYRSVDALISDVEAFLGDRPLNARKNAFFYTARKFAWRNRIPLGSAAFVLLVFIAGIVFFTIRLARARDAAVTAAAHSERVQRFTESLFTGGVAGYGVPPPAIKVAQMLDRGRSEALHLTGDPQLQNDMFRILGNAYLNLGQYADAEPLLKRAQQGICTLDRSIQCADVELALGIAICKRASYHEGEALIKDALQIKQKKLSANDPSIADAMLILSLMDGQSGDFSESHDLIAKALAIASQTGHPTPQLAKAMGYYGLSGFAYNDPQVVPYEERSAQMTEQLFGAGSYEYADSEARLALIAENLGKYDQAEQYDRRALAGMQAWSGPGEEITVQYMQQLALVLSLQGKFDESSAILSQSLSLLSKENTAPSSDIGTAYFWLGFNELHRGDLSAAEHYFDAVVSRDQQHLPVTDSDLETSELGLAEIYAKRGAFKRSEEAARHVVDTTKQGTGYLGAAAHSILGNALLREGRVREAEPQLELAYQWFSHDPKIRPHTAEAYQDLSEAEMQLGKPRDAARIREELRVHPN